MQLQSRSIEMNNQVHRKKLLSMQRLVALKFTSTYRTVLQSAVLVLAGYRSVGLGAVEMSVSQIKQVVGNRLLNSKSVEMKMSLVVGAHRLIPNL